MQGAEGWQEVDGALERTFTFRNFVEALAFVNRVGDLAESEGHHPDIAIRWNTVVLRLSMASANRQRLLNVELSAA